MLSCKLDLRSALLLEGLVPVADCLRRALELERGLLLPFVTSPVEGGPALEVYPVNEEIR